MCNDPVSTIWQLTTVYGPSVPSLRQEFWDCLNTIVATFSGPWMMVSYFNVVLSSSEKIGGQ